MHYEVYNKKYILKIYFRYKIQNTFLNSGIQKYKVQIF